MIKLQYECKYYSIYITKRDVLIINNLNGNHCHFKNLNDAIKFIKLMEKNITPWSKYWKNCKNRLDGNDKGGDSSC